MIKRVLIIGGYGNFGRFIGERLAKEANIRAISDGNGNGIATFTYDPYGVPDDFNGSRFLYTGQMALPEVSLYHYKARAYHPGLGRFLQTDPIGYAGGMNLYAYLTIRTLHILSSTILFGTGIGIAFFMFRSRFTDDLAEKLYAARGTVWADYIFTLPAVIFQPLTGAWLIWRGGYDWRELWLVAT